RDKGPAESLVNQVYKYYYSRVYNEEWSSIGELNARLMELNDQYNNEIMKGRTYSRRQKFETEELPYPFLSLSSRITSNTRSKSR
ncbi:MAG: hypothetical protein PHX74_12560, partial [Candidatus Sumerlaeales bacterium]|nr:hypothetical protein [Candidatus Sumerlaeales bacterium]